MTTKRSPHTLFQWMAGVIALLLLTTEIAAACSLAPPSVILLCDPNGQLYQDSVWVETYNVSDPDDVLESITDECADFDVDADTFAPIYKTWEAGVKLDFFEHSMLTIEPYSAERETAIRENPETCRSNTIEKQGDWLIHYGVRLPYCTVNPGDGASCPFLEIDYSEANTYCELNPTEAVCEALPTSPQNTRIIIAAVAAVAVLGGGSLLIYLIRQTGDD